MSTHQIFNSFRTDLGGGAHKNFWQDIQSVQIFTDGKSSAKSSPILWLVKSGDDL